MTLRRLAVPAAATAAAVAARCLLNREFQFVVVHGASMRPTLNHGDLVVGRRTFTTVSRGDVVVFRVVPDDYQSDVSLGALRRRVKRVAAVAGDPAPTSLPSRLRRLHNGLVPEGHVALVGDALVSEGSGQFGYIPIGRIESVLVRRLRRGPRVVNMHKRVEAVGSALRVV